MTLTHFPLFIAALAGAAVASVSALVQAEPRKLSDDELRALAEKALPYRPSDGGSAPGASPPGAAAADVDTGWRDVPTEPVPSRVRSTPRLRGGVHAGMGGASTVGVYSLGTSVGAEIGVQITPWLATSVEGYAETALGLVGRAHIGALVQVAPIRHLELGVGGGATSMYELNFVYPNETASLGVALFRATVRLPQTGELFGGRPGAWDLVFGAEGEMGWVFDGTRRNADEVAIPQDVGAIAGGGRVLVGFLL